MIPTIVANYVRLKLTNDVRELLDDPHGVFGRNMASEIIAYMQNLDDIAVLVDLHLSEMIAAAGSDFEYTRLLGVIMKARSVAPDVIPADLYDPKPGEEAMRRAALWKSLKGEQS